MKIYVPPHRLGDMGVGIGIFVCVFARLFVWLVGLFGLFICLLVRLFACLFVFCLLFVLCFCCVLF